MVQGSDLLGDGVNIAARLQAQAGAGGICISGDVYDQIRNKLSLSFKFLGEQNYKNIPRRIRTYCSSKPTISERFRACAAWRPATIAKMPGAVAAIAASLHLSGMLIALYAGSPKPLEAPARHQRPARQRIA